MLTMGIIMVFAHIYKVCVRLCMGMFLLRVRVYVGYVSLYQIIYI